jgi:hypothetical protein
MKQKTKETIGYIVTGLSIALFVYLIALIDHDIVCRFWPDF